MSIKTNQGYQLKRTINFKTYYFVIAVPPELINTNKRRKAKYLMDYRRMANYGFALQRLKSFGKFNLWRARRGEKIYFIEHNVLCSGTYKSNGHDGDIVIARDRVWADGKRDFIINKEYFDTLAMKGGE